MQAYRRAANPLSLSVALNIAVYAKFRLSDSHESLGERDKVLAF